MDIGKYELDDEKRGATVHGEAAEALALDSSVSGCVFVVLYFPLANLNSSAYRKKSGS
jgi:hypothetical protein